MGEREERRGRGGGGRGCPFIKGEGSCSRRGRAGAQGDECRAWAARNRGGACRGARARRASAGHKAKGGRRHMRVGARGWHNTLVFWGRRTGARKKRKKRDKKRKERKKRNQKIK